MGDILKINWSNIDSSNKNQAEESENKWDNNLQNSKYSRESPQFDNIQKSKEDNKSIGEWIKKNNFIFNRKRKEEK